MFNFKGIKPTKITPEGHFCECLICETARVKGWSKIPVSSSESKKKNVQDQHVQKSCSSCFSIIGCGIPHYCNKTSLYQNLLEVASKDKFAAGAFAKHLLTTSPSSPKGIILLSQPSGGHPFPVQIGSSSKPKKVAASLTTKDLVQLQVNTGISNSKMIKLASTLNNVSVHRTVEPNFPQKFQQINRNLSYYFTISSILNGSESKAVVHCKNLKELLEEMIKTRNISPNHIIKFGIGGGGGFLKVSLDAFVKEPMDSGSPTKRLLTTNFLKTSGVKKQPLVTVCQDLPENYENTDLLLELINAKKVQYVLSCHMNMAIILCGIQSYSSTHPCRWCNTDSKNLNKTGQPR